MNWGKSPIVRLYRRWRKPRKIVPKAEVLELQQHVKEVRASHKKHAKLYGQVKLYYGMTRAECREIMKKFHDERDHIGAN